MSNESTMQIKIPSELIENTIRAEMIRALNANGGADKFVEAIVRKALAERNNSYDRETKFEAAVNEAIRLEVQAAFREWLEEHKPKIRAALKKEMQANGAKRITDIVDKITAGLTYVSYSGNVFLDEK